MVPLDKNNKQLERKEKDDPVAAKTKRFTCFYCQDSCVLSTCVLRIEYYNRFKRVVESFDLRINNP